MQKGKAVTEFISVSVWVGLNILLALCNKFVFGAPVNFRFPILLSAIHMLCCSVLSFISIKMKWIPTMNFNEEEEEKIGATLFWFCGLYILNIAFGNISLQIVNMAMSQVVRATVPFAAIILSYFILKEKTSLKIIGSVLPVVVGVGLTVLHNVDFSWFSLVVLFIGIFLAALKVVMTNKYLTTYKTLHPIEFLYRIAPLSFCYLLLLSTVLGESKKVIQSHYDGEITLFSWVCAFATGFMAFALNWTNFIANRYTSALTMTVAGNIKQVTTVLISIFLFNTQLEWFNMVGVMVAFTGLSLYSYLKYDESRKKNQTKLPDNTIKV